jgi:hypothetical protein
MTHGAKYAQKLPRLGNRAESEFSLRAEYYRQTFDERMPVPAGLLGLDLYPDLKEILVQIGFGSKVSTYGCATVARRRELKCPMRS